MSSLQISKLVTSALISGILSGGVALAQETSKQQNNLESKVSSEKDKCKGHSKKDKNACGGKDGCGQKHSKKDKNACGGKDGCGQKHSKKDKNACGGKDGCGQKSK